MILNINNSEGQANRAILEVLRKLSNEQLINIIIGVTQKDETLKDSIIIRYSKGDGAQKLEECKKINVMGMLREDKEKFRREYSNEITMYKKSFR